MAKYKYHHDEHQTTYMNIASILVNLFTVSSFLLITHIHRRLLLVIRRILILDTLSLTSTFLGWELPLKIILHPQEHVINISICLMYKLIIIIHVSGDTQ